MSRTPHEFRVLLSTHNGSRFLLEQISSILNQVDVAVHLHIRDDGSSDDTLAMIKALAAADDRITYSEGEHLGPALSYLTMISESSTAAEFIALSDQDDVWIDGKLARAADRLAQIQGPAMYCSAVEVVDEHLSTLGIHRTCKRRPALENALVQNIATGSTIVINRPAFALFRQVPSHPVMHDSWIYAATAGAGTVIYDQDPWVLYRQHGSNAIGLATSPANQWVRRIRQHRAHHIDRVHTQQAAELLELLGSKMTPESHTTLLEFTEAQCTVRGRIRYAFVGPAFRQRRLDSIVYRFLCMIGRI